MSEEPRRWLKLLVPLAGLSVVPLIGLIYAATTTFGAGAAKADASSSSIDADAGSSRSSTTKTGSSRFPKSTPGRNASAKLCCEKLHDLAQVAEIDKRATYLAAGTACEAADDDREAFRQVASITGGERVELPPECKSNP